MDAGIFKRLLLSMRGRPNTKDLIKFGITVSQACEFIGDALIRRIPHYIPMMNIQVIPEVFPTCEPLLYGHLLAAKIKTQRGKENASLSTPASLLSQLVGINIDQISKDAVITSFGLDSLGGEPKLLSYYHLFISLYDSGTL